MPPRPPRARHAHRARRSVARYMLNNIIVNNRMQWEAWVCGNAFDYIIEVSGLTPIVAIWVQISYKLTRFFNTFIVCD